jgi:hypothetical protein
MTPTRIERMALRKQQILESHALPLSYGVP